MTHAESRASIGFSSISRGLWVKVIFEMTHAESRASIGFAPFVGQIPMKF